MKIYRCRLAVTALVTTILLRLIAAGSVTAQDVVSTKPFQEWSKDEVNKILTDSLWAKTQATRIQGRSQGRSIAGQGARGVLARKDDLGGAEAPLDYRFTLRLHSALTVRQALARREQLKWNYDQRSEAERKVFDRQVREVLLDCAVCVDHFVLSVGFNSENSSGNDVIYQWFGAATLPAIKGYIYIANERGERRELVAFIPPKAAGDDVFFIFPRLDEKGQPLLTATDKKLLFRMSDNNAKSITNFNFDISKLMVDGKVGF